MSTGDVVRIGTRASELALRQARQVQAALAARGRESALVTFTTVGDRRLDVPLAAIGAKGLFTQELEAALLAGDVDCCVHSLKDLPTESPAGVDVVAMLEREDPRDALVVRAGVPATGLAELPRGARVGTSSVRRRAQLLALRPDLEVRELRGNVPTRLRKIDAGEVDAAILAAAGLHRLDARDRVTAYLEPPAWLPAPGQGAIAIQVRVDDAGAPLTEAGRLLASLNHADTAAAVRAERAFLAAMEGGCQVPIGALSDGRRLFGLVAAVDGSRVVRGECRVDDEHPTRSARALAEELLTEGGRDILVSARAHGPVPSPQPE